MSSSFHGQAWTVDAYGKFNPLLDLWGKQHKQNKQHTCAQPQCGQEHPDVSSVGNVISMYMCVSLCMHACMHMYVCARGGSPQVSCFRSIRAYVGGLFSFWARSLAWDLPPRLSWQCSQHQGCAGLCLPSTGVKVLIIMPSMTYTGSGDGTWCLMQEASILWEGLSPHVGPHTPSEFLNSDRVNLWLPVHLVIINTQ